MSSNSPPDIWTLLETRASETPDAIAIIDSRQPAASKPLTYAELRMRALRLAGWLQDQGIGPGDRVAILALNGQEFIELTFALAACSAVLQPLNWRLREADLLPILVDAETTLLVADESFGDVALELLTQAPSLRSVLWIGAESRSSTRAVAPDANSQMRFEDAQLFDPITPIPSTSETLAHLYYTSGTTGEPKGVMLTHGNVVTHALCAVDELGLCEQDRWAHIAPMFHLADAWANLAITASGGVHVCLPRFEASDALKLLNQEEITLTNLVPTMLNLMVHHESALLSEFPSLRLILSGGAPIAPSLVERIMTTFGCDYAQTYGMTETSPYLTIGLLPDHLSALPSRERLAWKAKTGRPFKSVELRVADKEGRALPRDGETVGEIQVKGPTVTPGYWRNPQVTEQAFTNGWLHTGDLANWDHEGFVNIVDRAKDVVITGGENVYSTEVEGVLMAHPQVLEAAVVGRPHEIWGEVVLAAVVLTPQGAEASVEAATLEIWCRERLAPFKVPRVWEYLPELPKTGSGKTSKSELRDFFGRKL